ncbi:hypothetical protein RHGRI_020236 [Rhododendron griersonianum]|uniref:Uncharacterized protein n=1 Tax=Rhododendron griersonianum TaxID=479676 RepID=A0AAV6JK70_9ERIC|nr:hypothetical protein RHGRI_020236 [Rhododendron griersonianum]
MFRQSTSRTFNGRINVAFINIASYNILQQRPVPTARHTVFAFLISALFNFLQLQYQNTGTVSPFQTHPKTMSLALFGLLFYCIAYEVEPSFTQVGQGGMGLFGSILSVSLASVLFHNSVSLALYVLYVVFSNREMLRLAEIEVPWWETEPPATVKAEAEIVPVPVAATIDGSAC